jgi:hypothetical protein
MNSLASKMAKEAAQREEAQAIKASVDTLQARVVAELQEIVLEEELDGVTMSCNGLLGDWKVSGLGFIQDRNLEKLLSKLGAQCVEIGQQVNLQLQRESLGL